jgi:hypothetical protein
MVGIGIGVYKARSQNYGYLPTVVTDYITRVEADGGTVEGTKCLVNELYSLGYQESNYTISQNYYTRVAADSGTTEAKTCFENYIETLL